MGEKTLDHLINLIHQHTGIHMTERKESMIKTRIRPRMTLLKIETIEDYISHLESNQKEVQEFINQITTNETSFFRTPRIWEYFSKDYLANWKKENADKTLEIWTAASSTGEEGYSIAMTCLDEGVTNFKIHGTDISQEVVDIATKGFYEGRNFVNFSAEFTAHKDKYFDPAPNGMKAKRILKEHLQFELHNLFKPLKSGKQFDIVFLRNVLIYFTNEDQAKVLKIVSQHMKKGGVLVLGEAESIFRLETNFKYKAPLIYTNE